MCGIAGIIRKDNGPVDRALISQITELVRHRGPDAEGYFFEENLALGHRRLAILDLTPAGNQPMHYLDRYVLVFNGEVYNYLELKEELAAAGYRFHTRTDVEVVLAAFDHWGEQCVHHFNGMWAFALYDRKRHMLFCSRDRFGVKPFYYTLTDQLFAFASEIKQLLPLLSSRSANVPRIVDYLVLGLEEYDEYTCFVGIQKLLPGHNLRYDLGSHAFQVERYYSLRIDPSLATMSDHEARSLFRAELERAVTIRLRSDVQVGTCLSGGLDSSTVATLASKSYRAQTGRRFAAITAKASDPSVDETPYAERVAGAADLDWHVIAPQRTDFVQHLEEVVAAQEEPFGSPSIFLQYFVMRTARELNCPVLLDGQGGDECLLGYERYFPAYLRSLPLWSAVREFFNCARHSRLSAWRLLLFMFYFPRAGVRLNRLKARHAYLRPELLELINRELAERVAASFADIVELQRIELTQTQLPHLLRYEDRNSMHFAVETRLPFLDYRLVETALGLNNRLKIRDGWTKYVIRSLDLLPPEVAWRREKVAFEAPLANWMRPREPFLQEIMTSPLLQQMLTPTALRSSLANLDDRTLWKLFNVALWARLFQVAL
ncbi:MAG: asparagine synthase (glutamine-hydrolyzing) [candidate division KSB1 bacterium]|nr:asparagine synthase (glutamine-hydrolyzing) [candidate division KSB1 bacterium]